MIKVFGGGVGRGKRIEQLAATLTISEWVRGRMERRLCENLEVYYYSSLFYALGRGIKFANGGLLAGESIGSWVRINFSFLGDFGGV